MSGAERESAALHVFLLAAAGTLLFAGHHAARAYHLYVAPELWLGFLGSLLGMVVGGTISWRLLPHATRLLPWSLLALGLGVLASGYGAFSAFALGHWAPICAAAGIAATTALLTATTLFVADAVGRTAISLGCVAFLLHPLRLAVVLLCLLAGATLEARVGFLRSGAITLVLAVILAWRFSSLQGHLYGHRVFSSRSLRAAVALSAGVLGLFLYAAERRIPLRDLTRFPDEIVYTKRAGDLDYAIVSSPGGYELFSDGQLALSSLDEPRRTRALVAPVLAAAPRARSVLLLYGGLGAVEREILRDRRVEELTVVVSDRARLELSRDVAFLASRAASPSPRWHTDVAEPLPWLRQHAAARFDVVIADFPWPLGYREGKLYTRHTFSLLAQALGDDGVAVVTAASAFSAPESLSDILATLDSAGLRTTPYHVAVPTLGVATFVVASRSAVIVDAPLLDVGVDLLPRAPGHVATLHDQSVVTTFAEERERR